MKLHENGVYLLNGTEIIEDNQEAAACLAAKTGKTVTAAEAATGTMAYRILKAHNTSGNMEQLQIKFDNCQWRGRLYRKAFLAKPHESHHQ